MGSLIRGHSIFGFYTIAPDSKEHKIFLNFLLNYTLCHLLESPHGGDSDGMPQCIISWNGIYKYSPAFYLNLD